MFDKFPWLGWAVVGAIELIAVAIAAALWHFGFVAWWAMLVAPFVPPVAALVAGFFGLASAEANGENPFQ